METNQCLSVCSLAFLPGVFSSHVCRRPQGGELFSETFISDIATHLLKANFLYAPPSSEPMFLLAFDFLFICFHPVFLPSLPLKAVDHCGCYQYILGFLRT